MIKDLLQETQQKMEKALEIVREDLATVQAGRARPALVEKIKVPAYEGTVLEIRELANITAAGPQEIFISPWDKTIIKRIAQAISESGLNLTPIVDAEAIRIKVPPLTEERRRELLKLLQRKTESGRRLIREIRNETKTEIGKLKGEPGVSLDDIFRGMTDLQKLHDQFQEAIGKLGEEKKKELAL